MMQGKLPFFCNKESKARSIRIRIYPQLFLFGFAFRPHVSGESGLRNRNFFNPLSGVESLESCGRANPYIFKYDDVANSDPVFTA